MSGNNKNASKSQSTPSKTPYPPVFVELTKLIYSTQYGTTIYKFETGTEYAYSNGPRYMFVGQYKGYIIDSQIVYDHFETSAYYVFDRLTIDYDTAKGKKWYKLTHLDTLSTLSKFKIGTTDPTDKEIIYVFWNDEICKLVNVDPKNGLSLQCNDGIYHVDINGTDLDKQNAGKIFHKKRTTKQLSKNRRTSKHENPDVKIEPNIQIIR
jgi:hypothetical protein